MSRTRMRFTMKICAHAKSVFKRNVPLRTVSESAGGKTCSACHKKRPRDSYSKEAIQRSEPMAHGPPLASPVQDDVDLFDGTKAHLEYGFNSWLTAGYSRDAQAKAALVLLLKTKVCGIPLATRLMSDAWRAVSNINWP